MAAAKKKPTAMSGDERKKQLIEVGAKLASKHGVKNVTRRMVAHAAKVSEGLVANYCGNTGDAQKLYAKAAKKMGLPLPDKAKEEAIGKKLRAHGPRDARDTRKRTVKEVEAIKRKATPATPAVKKAVKETNKIAKKAAKKATPAKKSARSSTRATATRATAPASRSKKFATMAPPPGVDLPPLPPVNSNSLGTPVLPPMPKFN